MNARYYVGGIGRFASADSIVPGKENPQAFNRYAYVANNPLLFVDESGHCWGAFSFVRDINVGGYGYGTTCSNIDEALTIVQHSDATVGEKALAGGYIGANVVAHGALAVGSSILVIKAVPAAAAALSPYIYATAATAQTTAATYPAAAAGLRGAVETAAECSMTGGGCQWYDYAWGVATAGMGQRLSQPCSFSEDTLVTTVDGDLPISVVAVGDYVLAYHEESESIGYYPIVAVWSHDDPIIVHLTIQGETVFTTPEHPFYTANGEWVAADLLQVGDEIRQADWQTGTVEAISFIDEPQTMYNFTVASAHTYFVGEGQWLVHNACAPPSGASRRLQPDPAAQGPHTTFRRDGTTGAINHYATWELNPRNPSGFDLSLRFDAVGPSHYNKVLGRDILTPHIHSRRIPGGVGPASPNQIPHLHH